MNKRFHEIIVAGESFLLLPQKAIYRPAKKQLILGDLHLGKTTHFRKMGLPMPAQSHLKDLDTLQYLLNTWQPHTVIVLGDLFHSSYNKEWLWLKSLLLLTPEVNFILVEGNHDILQQQHYESIPNLSKTALIEEEHIIFSHHPLEAPEKLNFCGHLHPGLRIYGKAKQSEKLPCFYHDQTHFILPAFGQLTGLFMLEQHDAAAYYLVTGNRVIAHPAVK